MLEMAIIKYNFGLAKRSAPCIPLKDILKKKLHLAFVKFLTCAAARIGDYIESLEMRTDIREAVSLESLPREFILCTSYTA